MINVTELRSGAVFTMEGQLWQVLAYEHIKMGRGSANIKVKVRNVRTGTTTEKSFISGARVQEAVLQKRPTQYLYKDRDEYVFMETDTYSEIRLPQVSVGDQGKFLLEGSIVTLLMHEGEPVALDLPKQLEYAVTETAPGVKGDTVSNVYKPATLENGIQVQVPMFVKVGNRVKVDTKTGQYVERVGK